MDDSSRSLCEKQRSTTILETLRQLAYFISVDHLIGLVGIAILATWLLQTSLGRKSLVDAPPRRNSMAPYVPFIPFFIWFLGIFVVQSLIDTFLRPAEGVEKELKDNAVYCASAVVTVVGLILPLAHLHFARGLKGFGLRLRTIPRDFVAAFATLLAVWPLVLGAIAVTTLIGQLILQQFWGQNFEMPQHEALEQMTQHPGSLLQILLVLVAVVIAPVTEEMIFRGLFQTMLRSYLGWPWLAIIMTSVLFALVHGHPTHWPALFFLSLGLGYTYEKSGSLFRPVFMHAFFNTVVVLASLVDQGAGTT